MIRQLSESRGHQSWHKSSICKGIEVSLYFDSSFTGIERTPRKKTFISVCRTHKSSTIYYHKGNTKQTWAYLFLGPQKGGGGLWRQAFNRAGGGGRGGFKTWVLNKTLNWLFQTFTHTTCWDVALMACVSQIQCNSFFYFTAIILLHMEDHL